MAYSLLLAKQVVIMFLILTVGIICYKTKLINKESGKSLSALVLNVVTPAFIFVSYQSELSIESLKGLSLAFVLALLSHILMIFLSSVVIPKNEKYDYAIERFSVIYTNCGYMGVPLIEGVFGTQGILFATTYMTVFNLFVWTHGVMSVRNAFSPKDFINALKSPTIISIVLGIILYVTNIRLPEIITKPISYIGSMNTPLAMIVAGTTIAQTNIFKALSKPRIMYIIFLRLIAFPLILIPIMSLIPCEKIVFMSSMLSLCCPCAAIGTLFAVRYDKNAIYASQIFTISTILSALTMPIMISYMNLFR